MYDFSTTNSPLFYLNTNKYEAKQINFKTNAQLIADIDWEPVNSRNM